MDDELDFERKREAYVDALAFLVEEELEGQPRELKRELTDADFAANRTLSAAASAWLNWPPTPSTTSSSSVLPWTERRRLAKRRFAAA